MASLILYISRGHTEATWTALYLNLLYMQGRIYKLKLLEMQIIQIKVKRGKYESLMYKSTATTDMISNAFVSKGSNINT